MRNLFKKVRKKISLRRGHTSIKNKLTDYNNLRFCTRNELEFNKVTESDGEIEFLESFLSVLEESDIVFDIGANMGMFSLYSKARVHNIRLYCFEPIKKYYDILLENLKLNDIYDINTFNFGLGNTNRQSEFVYKNELGSGMGSGSEGYSEEYGNDFEKQVCQIKKGDTLIEQSKLPVPNVIKIDVEGMEMDVLEGLSETLKNKTCKYVFCEIHTRLNPALYGDVCNYLKQRGFKIKNIYCKGEGIGTVGIK